MARLYSRMNAGAIDDPQYGHFEPDPAHGGFDLPDELSDRLAGFCHRGKPAWETGEQRSERLHGEDLDRRRDPAMLYDAVGEFSGALRQIAGLSSGTSAAAEEIADLKRQLAELKAAAAPAAGPADAAKAPAKAAAPAAK
jgi:hypothetical protein